MEILAGTASTGTAVTVSIEDIAAPATFARLPVALAALWESLRALPLGHTQAEAYRDFLTRPDAAERVQEFLDRDGCLMLSFAMSGRHHSVRIAPAAPR
ncbi:MULTISPECIES: hypothetical protein [Kitasatospora]|uniref:Uncharacterized protein n=1 Tax=Kitasatospora cystarginea TaxID=58350 RepID=A0ABP5QK36_9ACTN